MKETRRGGVALLLAAVLVPLAATAHRLAPSLLEVRETAPGRIAVFWKTPLQRPVGAAVEPELPAGMGGNICVRFLHYPEVHPNISAAQVRASHSIAIASHGIAA